MGIFHIGKKGRIAFLTAAALLFGAAVSGCGESGSSEDTSAPAASESGKKTIGIAMPAKSLERWNRDGEYLKKMFEEQGYNVELRFSDNKADQQVNDIQTLLAGDLDVLIIAAIDGGTLATTLEDAKTKNVPVIAYDRLIMNTDAVSCYVSFDNFKVGSLQAQFIVDTLKPDSSTEPFNIELSSGDPADNNAVFFYNGSMEVLRPYLDSGKFKIPSGKVSFEQTATPGWSTDLALENMQNVLASYYSDGTRLDAVLSAYDGLSLGVEQAILSDYTGGNMPVITGQDADIAGVRAIVDGEQTMTIYKNVNNEAKVSVEVTNTILNGGELNDALAKTFSAECVFDTASYDNGVMKVPSYLLTPEIITVNDLDKLVATGTYKWDSAHKYLEAAD